MHFQGGADQLDPLLGKACRGLCTRAHPIFRRTAIQRARHSRSNRSNARAGHGDGQQVGIILNSLEAKRNRRGAFPLRHRSRFGDARRWFVERKLKHADIGAHLRCDGRKRRAAGLERLDMGACVVVGRERNARVYQAVRPGKDRQCRLLDARRKAALPGGQPFSGFPQAPEISFPAHAEKRLMDLPAGVRIRLDRFQDQVADIIQG